MMKLLRRSLQVVAVVGTLMVGILAVALIVSQTPWFRDWLRRYVVRESKQYLNGELTIGRIGGNLLFGLDVSDVAVDVSGQRVVAVKSLELDYSVLEFISKGIVLDEIKLVSPVLRVERDRNGWNLGRLVKEQAREADREGPARPISMPSIEVADANVYITDRVGADGYRLPSRIQDLDIKASFEYAPVHYSVDIDRVSFHTTSPQLALTELTGKLAVRDDNLYVESMFIRTAESALSIDGVVEQYLKTPIVRVTTTGRASLPEIARLFPAASGYGLHPSFDVRAEGPADNLKLVVDVKSEAGNARGKVTADVKAPNFAVRGGVDVDRLNLAPILKNPAQRTDLTGHAELDLRMASAPASAPFIDRMKGTYSFAGPKVIAAGYTATNVRVSGAFEGERITVDGRANAYGGTATAKGFIAPPAKGRAFAFDLRGAANNVDLRNLPAQTGAPKLATDLSVAEYHVAGQGSHVTGTALLNQSSVEGATLANGTTAEFAVDPQTVTYSARGNVAALNLQRVGRVMRVPALDKPAYDSHVNGDFDVKGSLPRTMTPPGNGSRGKAAAADNSKLRAMTLDASGTLRDSTIMGGTLPQLAFDAHLANGALRVHADGQFQDFDPATLSGRDQVKGKVTGTLNVNAEVANIGEPVTPETMTADGRMNLADSIVGGLQINGAAIDGTYANQIADLTTLQVKGPDLNIDAAGRVALDRTSQSALEYHIEATNLGELAQLAGQQGVTGAAVLDGTISGNAGSLRTTGTLDGSNVGYNANKALDLNSKYTVTVPDLNVKDATVEAQTTASFVAAGGMEINSLTAKTTYAKQRVEFVTNIKEKRRELDATGTLILHPDHHELHLPQLAFRTQGVEWRMAPGSEATIQYGQSRIELQNIKLVSGDQSLDVSGTLAMKSAQGAPAGQSKIDAHARNVDLQQLETLLLQNRGLTGKLNADATITGSVDAPDVDGHVTIANGGFKTYRYESLVADVDYSSTRVTLDATLQQSAAESITAKGTMPTSLFRRSTTRGHVPPAGGDEVDLQIKSTALNLGVIQGYTNQVTNVTGTLEADVRVTGSGEDPHLTGFIDIKGGAFGVPAGGVSYRGLDTRVELAPDRVTLQKFTILDEHNQPLNVSGELAVHEKEIGAVNITITSDNFEVIDNELGDIGIDSTLTVTGEVRRPRIEGDVRLEAARLEVDQILQLFYDPYSVEELPDVVSAEQTVAGTGSAQEAAKESLEKSKVSAAPPGAETAAAQPVPAPTGAFDPVALNVHVVIPDNLVLRGKKLRPGGPTGASLGDMNITVGGDVRVRKEPSAPVTLLGTVETIRGTYEFQGRRFDLVRGGRLRLLGEPQLNPLLDITATRVIPNTGVEARVHVTGTARAPQLQLTSNPPLDEADILSLIVFNRSVNELGTGERASLATTAGGIATGFLAAPLGESIGRALDLDLFEITTTTEEGTFGAGITVGQQIGDRAFVKLRQQYGERTIIEFMTEYQLARFMRVEATAAPETTGSANRIGERRIERAGIDLIFFFSY
jgi:translocation-and-assembly-module (TAM) inner membrane subunit TamB-like protein